MLGDILLNNLGILLRDLIIAQGFLMDLDWTHKRGPCQGRTDDRLLMNSSNAQILKCMYVS